MLRRKCKATGCCRYRMEGSDYCVEHQNLTRRDEERCKPFYVNSGRNNQRLYMSARWKSMRTEKLKEIPYCEKCGAEATEVHHVIPPNGDEDLFYDRTNLMSICHRCHAIETQRESEERKQRPKFVKSPRNRKLWY